MTPERSHVWRVGFLARGRRVEDSEGTGAALGQARLGARHPGSALRRHQSGERGALGELGAAAARAAPRRDGDEDGRRARADEGGGDEAGAIRLLHRHRVHPRGVPRDLPGAAREAAHRRAADALGEGRQGAGVRVRRRAAGGAVRRVRARGLRRGVDRAGAPGRAARRPPGRGEDPVPGDRRGARRRPAQRRHRGAARQGACPGPRRQGDRRRDPRAGARGARLRVRGAEPAQLRARLPRPSLHLRPRRPHPALAPPGPGHRVRRGDAVRAGEAAPRPSSGAASARSSSAAASDRSTTCSTSTPTPTPATSSSWTTGASPSSTSA